MKWMVLWIGLLPALAGSDGEDFLQKGDRLWVGIGMAQGYNLPFGEVLTVKKVRVLFMKEARVVFEEIPGRRYYLRTDFGPYYAFRQDPKKAYTFTPEEWETIRRQEITIGMPKSLFLCIKPKSDEIHYQTNPRGPIEQWIYREHPKDLFGSRSENPPTQIYFFQNDVLIAMI